MRSVDKGTAPGVYSYYKAARNDLGARLGWYCSYCEMPVTNMIEVEHVHPTANGGNALLWYNFLLCCRYCNGVKSNDNASRTGYFWPDIDNTTLVFKYSEDKIIEPASRLAPNITKAAKDTIDLMGLNRTPHSGNEPTDADSRWIARLTAFGVIDKSYKNWLTNQSPAFADQIALTAKGHGFYSFWMKKFQNEPLVASAINAAFPHTYVPQFDAAGNLVLRPNGIF